MQLHCTDSYNGINFLSIVDEFNYNPFFLFSLLIPLILLYPSSCLLLSSFHLWHTLTAPYLSFLASFDVIRDIHINITFTIAISIL